METQERRYKLLRDLGVDMAAKVEGVKPDTIKRSAALHDRIAFKTQSGPRILLFDIENAPSEAYIWQLWKDVNSTAFIKDDWYIMSWSAKWFGEKDITTKTLTDYEEYSINPKNDRILLEELWSLLDECDILIAHNCKKFDRRKVNARFAIHGMLPPSPYKIVDTLLEARKSFMFTSNALGDLGVYLGLGEKADTGGFQLWKDCMAGDLEAWEKMRGYNTQDVVLLEKVYIRLLPYMKNHPNVGIYQDEEVMACSKCGSAELVEDRTFPTNVSKFPMYRCTKCGAFSRGRNNIVTKEKRRSLLAPIAGQ